jgi:phosphotriesterase-related protein
MIMIRAAAIASAQTGAPIATHTNSKLHQGLYQQKIFFENGVQPHQILIGHSFDCLERDYLTALLDNGTYVGCDQIGIIHRAKTEDLAECVADLINMGKGYERQLFYPTRSVAMICLFYHKMEKRTKRKTLPLEVMMSV